MNPPPSHSDLILAVARGLPQPFSLSDLIIACWKAHQDAFGLSGYRDRYPDTNRIRSKIYGATGLIQRGLLEKVSTGVLHAVDLPSATGGKMASRKTWRGPSAGKVGVVDDAAVRARAVVPIPIEALRRPRDPFRCERLLATIPASTCIARQQASRVGRHADPRQPFAYPTCVHCPVGADVRARVKSTATPVEIPTLTIWPRGAPTAPTEGLPSNSQPVPCASPGRPGPVLDRRLRGCPAGLHPADADARRPDVPKAPPARVRPRVGTARPRSCDGDAVTVPPDRATAFVIIPIARLTSPDQTFRCEPYSTTMRARVCVLRQRATTGWSEQVALSRPVFRLCSDCADGKAVAKAVGPVRDSDRTPHRSPIGALRRSDEARGNEILVRSQRLKAAALNADLDARMVVDYSARPAAKTSPLAPREIPPDPGAVDQSPASVPASSPRPAATARPPTKPRRAAREWIDHVAPPRPALTLVPPRRGPELAPPPSVVKPAPMPRSKTVTPDLEEEPMSKCQWSEERCTEHASGGTSKYAALCRRHRQTMYQRDSDSRKGGGGKPAPKAPAPPPRALRATRMEPDASELTPEAIERAGFMVTACVVLVSKLGGLQLAEQTVSAIERLGGAERVRALADVLGTKAADG